MLNFFRVIKLTQLILSLIIFSACVRSVTEPPPKATPTTTPSTPSTPNNAPATPLSLSCATSPVGLSVGNTCTLTAASPADSDGDAISYADNGSTCAGVSVSVLTGSVTFTAPAKGASCLIKVSAYDGLAYSSAVSSATITGTNNSPANPSAIACATSPSGGSVGNICTLTQAGVPDIDGDTVTYSNNASTCAATVVNATSGNATFTAPAKGATCLVSVRAFDGTVYSGTVSSTTITGANNVPNTPAALSCPAAPVAGSTGNICTTTGANPVDSDGDSITYVNDASTCAATVVNAATGGVTFTAPATGVSCSIRVKAYDGSAYSVAVVSTINGTNNAPATPVALTCATSPLGGSLNNACTLTAASPADADGDTVSYSNDGSTCGGVVVNSTSGNATFTAPAKGATCLVKVKAFDGALYSGTITSATITGANNAPNTPTALSCTTAPTAGSLGNACTLSAAGTLDSDGDAITYVNDASTCSTVVVDSATGNATFTAPAKGASCVVKVKAYDNNLYSGTVTSASITGANTAPNIPAALTCAASPLGGSTNNVCTLTAATPADLDGDVVSYADDSSTCADVSVSALTGDATFTAPAKGATCLVKVKAHDGTTYGTARSSATITGINNAPTIPTTLSCVTSPLGGSINNTCTLTAASPADLDGDSVTYSDDGSTCGTVVVNSTSGNATFTAPAKGATCLVKIKSYDGTTYSSTKSSATITGANNAPTIPSAITCTTTPVAGSAGNTCTLTAASPADPDGDSVTYFDDGSTCSTTVVNSASGGTTFTAPALGATCLVKIRSFDSALYSSTKSSATITGSAAGAGINLTYSNTATPYYNVNIHAAAKAAGWDGTSAVTINVTINAGVSIGSSSPSSPSLVTNLPSANPTQLFPAGTVINITNNGTIAGAGGIGGSCNGEGGAGGNALVLSYQVTLNNQGNIWGGGGGGGAGGDDHESCPDGYGYGGDGAGINGASPTIGGAGGGTYDYHGDNSCNVADGGQGGSPGYSGQPGNNGNEVNDGAPGGAPGWAIIGTTGIINATWANTGSYKGNNSTVPATATSAPWP